MKKKTLSIDKKTAGMAALTAGSAGAIFIGELIRYLQKEDIKLSEVENELSEVAKRGYRETPASEQTLFNLLSGFLLSFVLARLSTYGIRKNWRWFKNRRIKDKHIHHFLPGIVLAFLAGGVGLSSEEQRTRRRMAFLMGTGMGLTLDEASLLLELRDVYWSEEGIFSLQASLMTATLLSGGLLILRILRRGEDEELAPLLKTENANEPNRVQGQEEDNYNDPDSALQGYLG